MSTSSLHRYRDQAFSLAELVQASCELLAGHVPTDARVSPQPDARTVRYYQTLGIVDRPEMTGRRARYGFRQLVQVVATKLLQGRGYSLAQVQTALSGRTTDQISAAAASALGVSLPPSPPPAKPAVVRPLVAAELAPGITVTIDPARVADVDDLVRRLSAVLASGGSS